MGQILHPVTGRPMATTAPSSQVQEIRRQILEHLRKRSLHAQYDAAQSTSQNENHWRWADILSPNSTNSLPVRTRLRSRSRYEVANNGYLKGIVLTKSQDIVGSGPTLQVIDSRFTLEQKGLIEIAYQRRAKQIKLRRKLRQLCHAKIQDGEGFAVRIDNTRLRSSVRVDQKIVECDQISHYDMSVVKPAQYLEIDGIRFSSVSGEPTSYHLLNAHPGERDVWDLPSNDGRWIAAEHVIHWFRRDRPWNRGIPETAVTLPLWALLRRYTLAVVQNAEIAADFTVLLKSLQAPSVTPFPLSGSPGEPSSSVDDWFASFPVDRGLMTVLPDGYDLSQLDPKQPVTMYDDFVCALVQEAARPLLVPRNMSLGNSGKYNMASGALDRQLYAGAIKDERHDCEDEVLDKDLGQWWFEAVRTPNYFSDDRNGRGLADVVVRSADLRYEPPDHTYRWDEIVEHTDPVKVATAMNLLHQAGHLSDVDIQEGRFNRRVEDHYSNLAQQQQVREKLGLSITPQSDGREPGPEDPEPEEGLDPEEE